jgi:hypothetical protein
MVPENGDYSFTAVARIGMRVLFLQVNITEVNNAKSL